MTYTPINWQTGDTITAEKMNKMDNGWGSQNNTVTYYSGSLTTENWGNYSGAEVDIDNKITAESITVTFDGTTYNVAASPDGDYGAPYNSDDDTYDFTSIPFNISSSTNPFTGTTKMTIATSSDGTYSVVVQSIDVSIETSANFSAAVLNCLPILKVVPGETTFQEVANALDAGLLVYGKDDSNTRMFYALSIILDPSNSEYTLYALSKEAQGTIPITIELIATAPDGPLSL